VRKILFGLVFLLVLLLAAEMLVTFLSQRGVEKALSSQYGLPSSLEASINSFPLILSLARNHIGELRLTWRGNLNCFREEGSGEEVETRLAYSARVNLYDVELEMTSLMTGKLVIRELSRVEARIFLEEDAINEILGEDRGPLYIDGDEIYSINDGEKTLYKVEVTGDNTLTFHPDFIYMDDSASNQDAYSSLERCMEEVRLEGLPLNSRLKTAGSEGGRVVLKLYLPLWEGYIAYLKVSFKKGLFIEG